jgi:UPF0755 protein
MLRWFLRLVLLAVVLGGFSLFLANKWLDENFTASGPSSEEQILLLPRGSGLSTIAVLLEREGLIEDDLVFKLGVRKAGAQGELKAGEYAIPAGASPGQIMEILREGKVIVRRVTVPEGLTSREVLALVAEAEHLNGDLPPPPPEGSLLPETYHYERGDSAEGLVGRMEKAMQDALAELWAGRAEGLPLQTPEEAVILASIVEKETGVGAERPLVASVFYNRLKRGMPLQSDPTVIFALTKGEKELGRALTRQDWKVDDPYNTYQNAGLPPGPIANPGRDALAAVLNPDESEYLYFVADGTGGHAFAKTLAEHNRNVAAWRKVQKSRTQ